MLVHSRTSHKERRGGGRNGLAAVGGEYYLTTQQETYDNVTCQTAVLHEFSVGMKAQSTYLCVALLLLHLHTVLCVSIYVFSFLPFYTFSIFYFFLSLSLSLFLCALENYLYTWLWGHGHLIFIYKYLKASRPSPCLAFTQLFFRYSVSIFHSTRGSRLNSLRRVRRLIGQEMEQTLPSQSQIWFVAETVSDQVREWVSCTCVITIKHMASDKKSAEEEILIYRDGGGVFVYLQSR